MSLAQTEKLERLNKRLIGWTKEYGKENVIVKFTKWDIEELERDIEDENLINSFSKRVSKAVRLMKKIHDDDLDEKIPDNKDVIKVKQLINKEMTDLELKLKELKNQIAIVNSISGYVEYDHPNSWYSILKRLHGDD